MFKKLKDKIEEVRQTPRLPVQSLAQQTEVDKDNPQSSLLIDLDDSSGAGTKSIDEDVKSEVSSPAMSAGNFRTVDLSEASATSTPNPTRTRTSSESSFQGEMSIPSYTPPSYLFNPQSDMESASEFEDSSPKLDGVTKAQIFEAFRKSRVRYQKYRGKYAELVKAYKEIDSEKEKIRTKLSESQDKSLRRIAELREEALLDKQAKNDMEVTYRIMLDEKDELINVLHTQVRLLKDGVPNDALKHSEYNSNDTLINSFSNAAAGDSASQVEVDTDALLEKNKRLESILLKCKENMKINKERISQLLKEKNDLQLKVDDFEKQVEQKSITPNDVNNSNQTLNEDVERNEELYILRVKIEEITREKEKLQETIDENHCQLAEQPDLQSKISELTSAHAQLEQNQHETNKLIQDLTSDKENLTKHLQNTSETLKTLIENLKKHETLGPKLQNLPIEDPDSIPTALTQLIQIFQSETDTLTYKLHRAADYAEEQTAKLETQTQTSEELTHHHETKILNLIHQIQAFENERDSLIDNATQHKQQVTNATLELQKHQFACNNLAMENEELKIQLSLLNEQLSEKDQELSQLATEKMAAEESLSAKLENKPDDESLSILLRKFEKEAADREIRLKMALDDLEMEKVMRQSTSESEAGWIKKFEESNMLVSQLQLIIAESDEEKRRDKHLLEDMRVEYEETSGKLAHELGIYQEGEMRLREELGVLQARQFDDRKRIVDELAKLEETVEILSRDKEELQQKLEIDVKLKDEEIQELKLIQVEKLTDLRDKTSESVGCLKEKIEKQAEELEDLKLQVSGSKEKETEIKNGCQLEIETYEEQIKLLQVEKEDLLVKLSESCLESDNLKEARQILQLESQKMADEFEKSRKILEENGKNVCQMEIESYDKEIKLLQAEKEDLLVKFTECCRERENLKEQSRILLLESEKMADEFEKNRKLLEEKELKIKNGCQQEMESYEEQMKLLQAEKEDLLAKFTESCRERDDFKELSRVLQMDTNKLAGDYENCRKMLGVKELELNEFRFSVEGKDNQIEQLEKLKIELIDKCDKSRNEFDNEKECLIKEIEDVKRKNKAKWEQREKDWSEEMNGKMMDLKKKAEQKLSQIKKQLQSNKDNAAGEIKAEVIRLQESIVNLTTTHQTEVENIQLSANNTLKDTRIEFDERIMSLEKQLQLSSEETSVCKVELSRLQETIHNLSSSHQTEIVNMQTSADNILKDVTNELQERIKNLEKQLQLAKEDSTIEKVEITQQLQDTISNLISSHKIELDNLTEKADNALSAIKTELREKISSLESELETSKTRSEALESDKPSLDKLNESISHLEQQITILTEEKEIAMLKYTELEKQFAVDKEALVKDIETKNSQIDESLLLAQENASEKGKLLEKNKLEMKKFALQLKKREDEIIELKKEFSAGAHGDLEEIKNVYEKKLAAKDDEQAEKIKELVKDFNLQLRDKEQEHEEVMFSTVEKLRNEKSQTEKDYQNQIKEILGDLQEKETYLENLIASLKQENEQKDRILQTKSEEYEKRISTLDHEHSQKLGEVESKTKAVLNKRLKENAKRHDEDIRGLTNEWNEERKLPISEGGEQQTERLEKQTLLTMAVIESNSGSNQLLRREVMSQTKEMATISTHHHRNEMERLKLEINNLQRLLESAGTAQGPLLTEPTQMEYLRNILFEYMMGRQTTTLAKVIAAVVKFTEFQTQKILEKEESRHNVLTNLLQS